MQLHRVHIVILSLEKSHNVREGEVLPLEKQISIDKQIEKFDKIIKATEKRNARIKELVETEVS